MAYGDGFNAILKTKVVEKYIIIDPDDQLRKDMMSFMKRLEDAIFYNPALCAPARTDFMKAAYHLPALGVRA